MGVGIREQNKEQKQILYNLKIFENNNNKKKMIQNPLSCIVTCITWQFYARWTLCIILYAEDTEMI